MRTMNRTLVLGLGAAALVVGAQVFRTLRSRSRRNALEGRVVMITGGSRGLGLVLAREFARQGARLVLTARDTEELARARAELRSHGADVLAVRCDVTDEADVRDAVTVALDWYGAIDVLVNNAGTIEVGPVATMTTADYAQAMGTHFWGPLHMVMSVVPQMRARGEGRIVNVSSIGGVVGVPHLVPYSASKFALTGLSEGLHAELSKDGITVTTVVPGLMRTGSPRNAWFKGDRRAEHAWFSVSDALPLVSMSAERAARRIVLACRRRESHVVLSAPAKVAALLHALAPGLTASLLAGVNRVLPASEAGPPEPSRGADVETAVSPSVLTTLSDQAAARNNEMRARA
jgi:NAD(P)-dependent dehydrogenase (short-subunit alcohol dehydrogenase family)